MIEQVEVEQVTVTSTATDAVTVGVEVESVQVGIAGPQGPSGTGGGGAESLDDLDDVTITSPATGAALVYNGTAWVDGPIDLADSDAVTGVLPDANIASTIARDSEVTAAVAAHESDTTSVHGIADTTQLVLTSDSRLSDARTPTSHVHSAADITSGTLDDARIPSGIARDSEVTAAIAAHAGEADPHTGYLLESAAEELIRDTIGTALVAGSNVTITPNDGADTITIASTGGGGGGALDDLSDVTITSPATGAVLVYNGTAWVDGQVDLADADAITGVLPDANIASTIARDSEVAAAYQPLDTDLTAIAGLSGVRGDVIYRDASQWQRLAKGTDGQLLAIGANDPAWSGRFGRVLFHQSGQSLSMPNVANNASEATLLAATYTLAANTLNVDGDCLILQAQGVLRNTTGVNRTVTLQIGPDAVTNPTFTTGNIASGATARAWLLSLMIRRDAAAVQRYDGYFVFGPVGSGVSGGMDGLNAAGNYHLMRAGATWSATSSQTFDLRVTLSTASTDLEMSCESITMGFLPKAI